METASYSALVNNAVLLLALGIIYDTLGLHNIQKRVVRDILSGLLIGAIALAVMMTPWELKPGVFFDARSVLLSLCGLFFGLRTTLIVLCFALSYRFHLGGEGIYIGLLVIVSTAAAGLACRYCTLRYKWSLAWWQLYLFGVAVHILMAICFLLLPKDMHSVIFRDVVPAILAIFPLGTMLLGLTLRRQRDRRAAERALRESESILNRERGLLRGLIDAIPDLIFVKNTERQYVGCNRAFEEFTASDEKALHRKSDIDLFAPEVAKLVREKDLEIMASGEAQSYECKSYYPDGREVILDVYKAPFFGLDGTLHGVVGISRDTTEKRAADRLIWQQANFDTLTGLPNRNMMRDRMTQEIKKADRFGGRVALMFLDLDRFKEVNDTLGHDKGDDLLVEAAKRISSAVRECDTVARQGGDEFTVVLGELDDPRSIEKIAQHILDALSEPFQLGDEVVYVTGSIGTTIYPDDGSEIDQLLKNADQAMYAAKNLGRNRYAYYTPSLHEASLKRVQLATDLRGALKNNQFSLCYQPIICLQTGQVCKAEALIRWQHPMRGFVSPAEFISVAEDSGRILEIGQWVFEQAVEQLCEVTRHYNPAFQISVNTSPVQFLEEGCRPQDWVEMLEAKGLPGTALAIEITEGLLMESSDTVSEKLMRFRNANVEIALDDFGTGYSSLAYLRRFDIDYLKIDKTFVSGLTEGSDDMALCEAMIVMAHKLGIKVIAEGIETAEQCALLTAVGCDFGQGYYFARPLPSDQFREFLAASVPELA